MTDRDPFSPVIGQEESPASDGADHQQDAGGDDEVIMPGP